MQQPAGVVLVLQADELLVVVLAGDGIAPLAHGYLQAMAGVTITPAGAILPTGILVA